MRENQNKVMWLWMYPVFLRFQMQLFPNCSACFIEDSRFKLTGWNVGSENHWYVHVCKCHGLLSILTFLMWNRVAFTLYFYDLTFTSLQASDCSSRQHFNICKRYTAANLYVHLQLCSWWPKEVFEDMMWSYSNPSQLFVVPKPNQTNLINWMLKNQVSAYQWFAETYIANVFL